MRRHLLVERLLLVLGRWLSLQVGCLRQMLERRRRIVIRRRIGYLNAQASSCNSSTGSFHLLYTVHPTT